MKHKLNLKIDTSCRKIETKTKTPDIHRRSDPTYSPNVKKHRISVVKIRTKPIKSR